jgi:hypothetical protein
MNMLTDMITGDAMMAYLSFSLNMAISPSGFSLSSMLLNWVL